MYYIVIVLSTWMLALNSDQPIPNGQPSLDVSICPLMDVLDQSDFESGWGTIWSDANSNAIRVNDATYANSGNYAMQLNGSDRLGSYPIDLMTIETVEVSFSFINVDFESSGETLSLIVDDPVNGISTQQWVVATDFNNGKRTSKVATFQGPFSNLVQFKFELTNTTSDDYIYIDDIVIQTCQASDCGYDTYSQVNTNDITCNGPGEIDINVLANSNNNNLNSGFEFSIDGGNTWHSNSYFSGLSAGSYHVVYRHFSLLCEVDGGTYVISNNATNCDPCLDPQNVPTITNVSTTPPNDCDGNWKIEIEATSSGNNLSYSVDGGNNWEPGQAVFDNLIPGEVYQIQVRNNQTGCISIHSQSYNFPVVGGPYLDRMESEDASDCGQGSITIHLIMPTNRPGSVQYQLENTSTNIKTNWQTSNVFTGLDPGEYQVIFEWDPEDPNDYNCTVDNPSSQYQRTIHFDPNGCSGPCDPINLALNQPASQSSDYGQGSADLAVDGDTTGTHHSNPRNLQHTGYDEHAWWQVELSALANLENINIYNRTNCCQARLSNFYVFIAGEPFDSTASLNELINDPDIFHHYQAGQINDGVNIPVDTIGQYVRVQLSDTDNLHMSEVQVFGCPIDTILTPSCPPTYLSDLDWSYYNDVGRTPIKDLSSDQDTLSIAGQIYSKGLGVHAPSDITYALNGQYATFNSWIGVDDESCSAGSVIFEVYVDGQQRFQSSLILQGDTAQYISVDVNDADSLRLVVTDGGNGTTCDHADWVEAQLICNGTEICDNNTDDDGDGMIDCADDDCPACATCNDGIQNGDETGVDCGGSNCPACTEICNNNIDDDNDGLIDCEDSDCPACITCNDGIQNGDETGVDCGGSNCPACTEICNNNIDDDNDGFIDCADSDCPACITCNDGIQNGDETGIDCGGSNCPICPVEACTPVNLALNQTATQSSTYSSGLAGLAVDGNTTGSNPHYVTADLQHTGADQHAWWQVVLAELSDINSVKVYNRSDGHQDRLKDFYVFVSENPISETSLLSDLISNPAINQYYHAGAAGNEIDIPLPSRGQYVRVQLSGTDNLHMAEVEVMGCPISVDTIPTACPPTYVSDLDWVSYTDQGRIPRKDVSSDGLQITIGGTPYNKGLGVHAPSGITYALNGQYETFTSWIGVDDESCSAGSVIFEVYVDGSIAYQSSLMEEGEAAQNISVDVSGANEMVLLVTDGGNGTTCDHADWADAQLICSGNEICDNNIDDDGDGMIDCADDDCPACATCNDGIQNGDETGVDCGGSNCPACTEICNNNIDDDNDGLVDCADSDCPACITCNDGIQNGDETGVDCGGSNCPACTEICNNNIDDDNDGFIDCADSDCPACITCNDGIQNADETGIDCGGSNCPICPVEDCTPVNLALNQTATQSSTYSSGLASLAVDGNTTGSNPHYVTADLQHTGADQHAWWQVVLAELSDINSVKVYNRSDGHQDRLKDFYVFVSENPISETSLLSDLISNPAINQYYHAGAAGNEVEISLPSRGQYVRVQLSGTDNLHMAEVEVMGCPISVDTVPTACPPTYVSDLDWVSYTDQGRIPRKDVSSDGLQITIGGTPYNKGLGVHAPSGITYALNGQYETFTSWIGVDDESCSAGSVIFEVYVDGSIAYQSSLMEEGEAAQNISVDVSGANEMVLLVTDGGNGTTCDHADWADAQLICSGNEICDNNIDDDGDGMIDCADDDCPACATCNDGIQNGDETGVDCGGSNCPACTEICNNNIDDDNDGLVDCADSDCPACITCNDGIQNGDETGVDCGGSNCPACTEICNNNIDDDNDGLVDCADSDCPACITCNDGIQNGDETGIDCGGSNCPICPVEDCAPTNLALNQSATQSSTYSNGLAGLAVDGNTTGSNPHNTSDLQHTGPDQNAWWQVALAELSDITSIKIYNRTDCCQNRLKNFYVFVSEKPISETETLSNLINDNSITHFYHSGEVANEVEIVLPARGKYVRIQLTATNNLHLAEVEVMGCQVSENPSPSCSPTYLSDLDWTTYADTGRSPKKDQSSDQNTLTIANIEYTKGLGVHALSNITYNLGGQYTTFTSWIGVDDESCSSGSVIFEVYSDSSLIYQSPLINQGETAQFITVDISGVNELQLVVSDGGNGTTCDHADWAEAQVSCAGREICSNGIDDDGDGLVDFADSDCIINADIQIITYDALCDLTNYNDGKIEILQAGLQQEFRLTGTETRSFQTTLVFDQLPPGTYDLWIKKTSGEEVAYENNPIEINCLDLIGPDLITCPDACVRIGGLLVEDDRYCIGWQDDEGNYHTGNRPEVCPSETTVYSAIVTDDYGNVLLSKSITVEVLHVTIDASSNGACAGQPATLTANSNVAGDFNYAWSTGENTSSISVDRGGIYTVSATIGACTSTASIELTDCDGNTFCQVEQADEELQCGATETIDIQGQELLTDLRPGDSFFAGEFKVEVTSITGRNGVFSGEGTIKVPYFNQAQVNVSISQVTINSACQMVDGYVEVKGLEVDILGDQLENILDEVLDILETIDDVLEKTEEIIEVIDKALAIAENYLPDGVVDDLVAARDALQAAKDQYDAAKASGDPIAIQEAEAALEAAIIQLKEAKERYKTEMVEFLVKFLEVVVAIVVDLVEDCVISDLESAYNTAIVNLEQHIDQYNQSIQLASESEQEKVEGVYLHAYFEDTKLEEMDSISVPPLDTVVQSFYETEMSYLLCLSLNQLSQELNSPESVQALNELLKQVGFDLIDVVGTRIKAGEETETIISALKTNLSDQLTQLLDHVNYPR